VYVGNLAGNSISVIDAASNTVIATIFNIPSPHGLALSPDGSRLYVGNYYSRLVTELDTATNQYVTSVLVGQLPVGIAVTPDASQLYVANFNDNTLSLIRVSDFAVIASIPVGQGPGRVLINSAGTLVYVSNMNSDTVSVISTTTHTLVATIPAGSGPLGLSMSPDGRNLFVANAFDSNVLNIDAASRALIDTVAVPGRAFAYGDFVATPIEPAAMLRRLLATLRGLGLDQGSVTSLSQPVLQAMRAIQRNDGFAVCAAIDRFIDQVRRYQGRNALTSEQAGALLHDANAIAGVLSCHVSSKAKR
jgi:YVTN family beta-propeller protein